MSFPSLSLYTAVRTKSAVTTFDFANSAPSSFTHLSNVASSFTGSSYLSNDSSVFAALSLTTVRVLAPVDINTPVFALRTTVFSVTFVYTAFNDVFLLSLYLSPTCISVAMSPLHDQPLNTYPSFASAVILALASATNTSTPKSILNDAVSFSMPPTLITPFSLSFDIVTVYLVSVMSSAFFM